MLAAWIIAACAVLSTLVVALHARATRQLLEERLLAKDAAASQALSDARAQHTSQLARIERDAALTKQRAPLDLTHDLLPAIDALEQAREQAQSANASLASFASGLDLAIAELERALAKYQITPVRPAPNQPFNPALHEAVSVETPPPHVSPGHVIACLRSGWIHPSRTLRPAMVRVAAKHALPDASSPAQDSPSPDAPEQNHAQQDHAQQDHATPAD
jgi:molecular chaperone GrpE (heat shock protein)